MTFQCLRLTASGPMIAKNNEEQFARFHKVTVATVTIAQIHLNLQNSILFIEKYFIQ